MPLAREELKAVRSELQAELAGYPTKDDLRAELGRYPTKDDLRAELARYVTKDEFKAELARYMARDELKAELERFATKEEFGVFREETANAFGDLRRYMEILTEDVISKTRVMFDGLAARIEALDRRVSGRTHNHEARIGSLEVRTSVLETRRAKRR